MTTPRTNITLALQKRLAAELFLGERVLYSAQPNWHAQLGMLTIIFLGSLGWCAVSFAFLFDSVASVLGVPNGGETGPMPNRFHVFLALPCVGIGGLGLAVPFISIRKSKNTTHVITDRRLLNVYDGAGKGVESYRFEQVSFVVRRDRHDGTGTLEIGYGQTKDSDGEVRLLTTDWYGIPDVRRAEALIHEYAKLAA